MKNLFRVLVMFVVVPATYYFLYWVPFSLLPFDDHQWIPTILSLLCAASAGWYTWKILGSTQSGVMSNVALGALVLGGTGFSAGFFGPIIIAPCANQGPLLGIFLTGPSGFAIGAVLGFVVGEIRNKDSSEGISRLASRTLIVWQWLLWACAILTVTVIAAVLTYVPWHQSKYSSIIESASDLQKRSKTLTNLDVRSLSDEEINQLRQFANLSNLDFHSGWGVQDAKISDAGLKNLSQMNLPKLERLMLGYCNKITDEGMKYVASIKTLKYLSIAACPRITDAGLANLATSSSIVTIDLRGCTGITDRGLGYLKTMPNIREISLGGCSNVSEAGIEELRQALPNSKIEKDEHEWAMHVK